MQEVAFLRRALVIAKQAKEQGNLPFGCVLVDSAATIIEEAGNTVNHDRSAIAHCELNLIQQIAGKYGVDFLRSCTIYCSVEPCPMCAGAIYWSGIGRVVFALDTKVYNNISQAEPELLFEIPCKAIIEKGTRRVEVLGPALEQEAAKFYRSLME